MSKKRIKIILPVTAPDWWLDSTREACAAVMNADTELDIHAIAWGPSIIEQHYDDIWAELPALLLAEQAEQEGFDGVLVYCAGDPAVRAIRESLTIPTVGLLEASVHLAYILGRRFSVITTLDAGVIATEDLLRLYDCRSRCASIRVLGMTVQELENQDKTVTTLFQEAELAVKEDHADVLILGCGMMMGPMETITERLGIPLINPGLAALKMLESIIEMNLSHSKLAYPTPQNNRRTWPGS